MTEIVPDVVAETVSRLTADPLYCIPVLESHRKYRSLPEVESVVRSPNQPAANPERPLEHIVRTVPPFVVMKLFVVAPVTVGIDPESAQ